MISLKSCLFREKVPDHAVWLAMREQGQSLPDDLYLKSLVERFSQRVAMRKRDKQGTRGLDFISDLSEQRQRNRRNAALFNNSLNQSNGLIAHGSSWN